LNQKGDLALKVTLNMLWVKLIHPLAEVPALFFYHPDSLYRQERIMDVLKTLGTRLLNGWQLSRLSTFEVAARHESFALAADELALTPSRQPPD
jgi:LysR family D-serine deaminase transcriptional activator